MEDTEFQLLEKVRNNDEVAFKVIYNTYFPKLYYFVFEFIPQHDLVENIVQDTFITFWNKRTELKEDTNLSAFLFTVAKNNCLYRLRDQRYRQKLFSSASIGQKEVDLNLHALSSLHTSDFIFNELNQLIEKTLAELPPQCKTVFILSRFEDKKNREIAEELGISIKAVEGHISKGLKKFRTALKDYLPLVAYLFIG